MAELDRTEYLETFFEIAAFMTLCRNDNNNQFANLVNDTQGIGGFWELAEDWANEFQEIHKNNDWVEEEFFETIDAFCQLKADEYVENNL